MHSIDRILIAWIRIQWGSREQWEVPLRHAPFSFLRWPCTVLSVKMLSCEPAKLKQKCPTITTWSAVSSTFWAIINDNERSLWWRRCCTNGLQTICKVTCSFHRVDIHHWQSIFIETVGIDSQNYLNWGPPLTYHDSYFRRQRWFYSRCGWFDKLLYVGNKFVNLCFRDRVI